MTLEPDRNIPASLIPGAKTHIDGENVTSLVYDSNGQLIGIRLVRAVANLDEALARHHGISVSQAKTVLRGEIVVEDSD